MAYCLKAHNAFICFNLVDKLSYLIAYAGIFSYIADQVYIDIFVDHFSPYYWQVCSNGVVVFHLCKNPKNPLYILQYY